MKIDPSDFPTPDSWYSHFVSYGETDAAGVLYYAEYLHLFERARSKFMRDFGSSYARVEERGVGLPVREAQCRYLRPARYENELGVRCGVSKWGRATLTFAYQVWGPPDQGTLLAVGHTEHVSVDRDFKPVAMPSWLRELIGS